MEAALVSVSTAVLKPLLSKLTKLLSDKYVKLKWVRRQIKFLRDELSTMSATLQMLADAEELNPQMRDWRDKVRELAYDIEDCVDTFMAKVDHEHRRPMGFSLLQRLKELKARHNICKDIQELKARAAEVSDRHKRYNFFQGTHSYSTSGIDPRLPALYVEVDRLVGINSPRNHIMERLFAQEEDSSSAKLRVISIVGCGGLGKTTLANQVYHTVKSNFDCAALVSVSRNPNMKRILRDIAKGLAITDCIVDDDEHQLISKLRGHLQQKRYFVVIDDIWDEKAWEIIKLALLNNNRGSRIITTSRNVTVASCCSSGGGYVYRMQPLSFDDSKRLCFRRAFGHENFYCPHLGDAPDQILRKCGGLPLAVITVSSMLTDQHTRDEWDRVLNAIGSALAKNPGAENMTTILSMSDFDLPHHLKTCLLYLSAFPEDHRIGKQRLINRWAAEGFIHEEQGQSAYDIGEHYFNDLINRSLIQPVDVKYGNAQACQVHDIILDFITCKATEENFLSSLDTVRHGNFSDYQLRRLSVFATWPLDIVEDSAPSNLILSKVRSLTIFGHPVQTSFLAFSALRVLDLEDCWELKNEHLSNIEKLFHLKYLCMNSLSITYLPEKIGELQYLETLDIRGTRIQELPTTMVKLQRLTHLYIDSDIIFQEGMIRQMMSLEVLKEFGIHSLQAAESLQEFGQLIKLRTLVIAWNLYFSLGSEGSSSLIVDPQSYLRTLICTSNIHNIYIHDDHDEFPWFRAFSMESWSPTALCSLQKLHITGCSTNKVPKWLSSLGNLKELELHIYCTKPEDLEILGAIPSLLSLELVTLYGTNGRITFSGTKGFRNLKSFSLYIMSCGTALEIETGSMPKLEHLKLRFCVHKTGCLNGASTFGMKHLSTLTKVEVVIRGDHLEDCFDSLEYMDDSIVKSVASTIKDAVQTHPNCPTISFETEDDGNYCRHFKLCLERIHKRFQVPTEWLGKCEIEEDHTKQVRSEDAEREDHNTSRLNVLDEMDEDEEEERERFWQEQLEAWMDTDSLSEGDCYQSSNEHGEYQDYEQNQYLL